MAHKHIEYIEKPAEGAEYERYAAQYGWTVPLTVNEDDGRAVVGLNYGLVAELTTQMV